MLKLNWITTHIKTNQQANDMLALFDNTKPKVGAFDTETDGLHIILNKPFLFQFGWIDPNLQDGYAYVVDIEQQPDLAHQVIKAWHKRAQTLKLYLAHNAKFDMHMVRNIGHEYTVENISDTQFYIRFAHDAVATRNGGVPLALKEYCAQYIYPNAKIYEKKIKSEQTKVSKHYNVLLKQALKNCGAPPAEYKAKSYTLTVINKMFSDPLIEAVDLPDEIKMAYAQWHSELPDWLKPKVTASVSSEHIPYNVLNRKNMIDYSLYDIVDVLEVYLKLAPVIEAREQQKGLKIEKDLVLPLYEMEKVGFCVDVQYIKDCKIQMKEYIKLCRNTLINLTGEKFTIGQHAKIKEILTTKFRLNLDSTGSEVLDKIVQCPITQQTNPEAVEVIKLIQEIRTLEKWYSTYIMRFTKELQQTNRLYTTIHQVGAVSGRVTSDFQQFPKNGITATGDIELFHPRKMVKPTGGVYPAILYLDYSQIELRFQAFYTILVGSTDTNLCRAYMPYKCINKEGIEFNYENPQHIKDWNKEWFLKEEPSQAWEPLDVHGATTTEATGLTKADPEFKKLRGEIGKRVNFAKNYGAQLNKIKEMFPDKTEEEAQKINDAYYKAFPGVKAYHNYCYGRALEYSYTENLFGIKYYNVNGHKLINMLVQGSAAYFLKLKMIAAYKFCRKHNLKTRYQMNIHDELSWEYHKDDPAEIVFELKTLMEAWTDTYVPIVTDVEITTTTWKEKKEVTTLDEIRHYLQN